MVQGPILPAEEVRSILESELDDQLLERIALLPSAHDDDRRARQPRNRMEQDVEALAPVESGRGTDHRRVCVPGNLQDLG